MQLATIGCPLVDLESRQVDGEEDGATDDRQRKEKLDAKGEGSKEHLLGGRAYAPWVRACVSTSILTC